MLGDLAVTTNRARLAEILDGIAGLSGTKHLNLDNHDTAHPKHRDAYRHQRTYLEVFESVRVMARRRIFGVEVMLSHYPYVGDHTADDRDLQYRLRDAGRWLLHGHLHTTDRITGPRQVNVGLEEWDLTPVPEVEIGRIMTPSAAS